RLAGENTELADAIEHVEIAEHRTEHRIDQGKSFAVEPWCSRDTRREPREFFRERCDLGVERCFVLGAVEAGNVVQYGRAELDPAAVLGALQRITRVQRIRLGLLEIFEDNSG